LAFGIGVQRGQINSKLIGETAHAHITATTTKSAVVSAAHVGIIAEGGGIGILLVLLADTRLNVGNLLVHPLSSSLELLCEALLREVEGLQGFHLLGVFRGVQKVCVRVG